jgi:glycosyltransferase involved in cell wall biosynthesis
MPDVPRTKLNILHVLRAPVGGLFRHVVDLARGQQARGHRVGLIADLSTGGARAEAALAQLSNVLALGVTRIAMSRQIGKADVAAIGHVAQRAADTAADVVHGHGAKGGAYARLAHRTNLRAARVYTPHGGSLHYRWGTPAGFLYLSAERMLMGRTDLFLFESAFGRDAFRLKVGTPAAPVRVVHNGVTEHEFEPVVAGPNASNLIFVGELRMLKGVDVLIKAISLLAGDGRRVTATIAGDGPDRATFEDLAAVERIAELVHFIGATPARDAFARGRLMVVPSRAESLPYVVLEAAAAGVPQIATRVGGIPEIFGPDADDLVVPGDSAGLARAIAGFLADPGPKHAVASRLTERVRASFSIDAMTDAVLAAYRDALSRIRT